MSNIDTINSKSNLDCIADELFTELTLEEGTEIKGGHSGSFDIDSLYEHPTTFTDSNGYISVRFNSYAYNTALGLSFVDTFNVTFQQLENGVFTDVDTETVTVGSENSYGLQGAPGKTGRLKFTEPDGFDNRKVAGTFDVTHS